MGNIFDYIDESFFNKIKSKDPLIFYNMVLNQDNDLLKAVNTKAGHIARDGVGMIDISCNSKLIKELKPFLKKSIISFLFIISIIVFG